MTEYQSYLKTSPGHPRLISTRVKIAKFLNKLVVFAGFVVALSCSSVQTDIGPTDSTAQRNDQTPRWTVSSPPIDPTIRSPSVNDIKPNSNQFPNVNSTASPVKPTVTISDIDTSKYLYRRGYEHYRKKEYDLAIDKLTHAIRMNPSLSAAYWVRGLSHYRKDSYEKANNDYSTAIKLDPNESKLYRNRGMVQHRLNLERHAIRDFTQAIEIDANFVEAYRNRAHSYITLGKYQDALADLDSAIRLDPSKATLYKDRADVYETMGLNRQADADNAKACLLVDIYC